MKMEVTSDSRSDVITELVRSILNGICKACYSGKKFYVWSKARLEDDKVVSIKNVIDEFKDRGVVPIDSVEEAFKFPFIIIRNIKFISESSVEVLLLMYFINSFEPLGIKFNFTKLDYRWKAKGMNIVLIG